MSCVAVRNCSLAVCALIVVSCNGQRSSGGYVNRRDSAGIDLVENVYTPRVRRWIVSESPDLSIGATDGGEEFELFRIRGVRRFRDGRIVVANAGTSELRFFEQDGAFVKSVGREGDGPGEFKSIATLSLTRFDTVLVQDWRQNRISVFDPWGFFVRSIRLTLPDNRNPGLAQGLPDGGLLVRTASAFTAGSESGVSRDSVSYYVVDQDGEIDTRLGWHPGVERFVYSSPAAFSVTSLPFGRESLAAVGSSGIYLGNGDSFEFKHYTRESELIGVIRLLIPLRAVESADVERQKDLQMSGSENDALTRRILDATPFPEYFPAFDQVLVDDVGYLWARQPVSPRDNRQIWDVFAADGEYLAEVDMPRSLLVLQIGVDYVLGVQQNEFDIELVRMHHLNRK